MSTQVGAASGSTRKPGSSRAWIARRHASSSISSASEPVLGLSSIGSAGAASEISVSMAMRRPVFASARKIAFPGSCSCPTVSYSITSPPQTAIDCPVMKEDAPEARNRSVPTRSSVVSLRLRIRMFLMAWRPSSFMLA